MPDTRLNRTLAADRRDRRGKHARTSIHDGVAAYVLPARLVGASAAGGVTGGGSRVAATCGHRPREVPAPARDSRGSGVGRDQIDRARRTGVRVDNPYGYERAFKYSPERRDWQWLKEAIPHGMTVLDPTAGGGSVPFETLRTGFTALANDLNPVAALVMKATIEWPSTFALNIGEQFEELAADWRRRIEDRLSALFPQREVDQLDATYLWARTVTCPYCDGLVPLSPNWRLAPDGTGVRLRPDCAPVRGPTAASARSRSSPRPKSSFPARWPAATATVPMATAAA